MKSVFLVFLSDFPDTDLVGVFSTHDKAFDFIARKNIDNLNKRKRDNYFIKEAEIDKEFFSG